MNLDLIDMKQENCAYQTGTEYHCNNKLTETFTGPNGKEVKKPVMST